MVEFVFHNVLQYYLQPTSCPKNKSGFIHGTLLPEQPVLVYSNESYGCGGGAPEWMSPHGEVLGF